MEHNGLVVSVETVQYVIDFSAIEDCKRSKLNGGTGQSPWWTLSASEQWTILSNKRVLSLFISFSSSHVSRKLRTMLSVFTLKEIIQHILQSFLTQMEMEIWFLNLEFASASGATSRYGDRAAGSPFIDPSLESFDAEFDTSF
jgi:hypothetical protein